jgi:hypothetical protein
MEKINEFKKDIKVAWVLQVHLTENILTASFDKTAVI